MILNKGKSVFERDFAVAKERFPKLRYGWNAQLKMWVITGDLDICDTAGAYWNTFQITMLVPCGYPYSIPVVAERSIIIPRHIDWHISPEGLCCLDAEHSLIALSKRGIYLGDFIAEKVYTFFANQIHKLECKEYAGAEYAHHTAGVIQYYIEELNMPSVEATLQTLTQIFNKQGLGRNDKCPCGSHLKLKVCHDKAIETIKSFGRSQIKKDIEIIQVHIASAHE